MTQEYGCWARASSPPEVAGPQTWALLRESLAQQLRAAGRGDLVQTIEPWDVEARYGRARLKLGDDEFAIGVHTAVAR